MTSTLWTTVVAVSAIGLALSPTPGPRPLGGAGAGAHVVAGGPPDTLVANPAATSIRWRGAGFGGRVTRDGTVQLASGMLVIRHQQLTSGTFTIDMRTLDAALRTPDYFDVERNPTAVFRSSGMKRIGPARWQVAGDLTMRGVTKPITFDSDVSWPELGHMVATSTLTLDRRQWGVASRTPGLAGAVADNDIQVTIALDASRKQARVATR
jgi:polyisoprenoid-binding protein YceI